MANVAHPYDYRRAVLAENAKAGATGAAPNLADTAREYAAGQGKAAVEEQALKSDLEFGEKKLAEQNRQFTARLDMDRDMLDTWGKQNSWATGIAIANLGVQALGIPANQKTLEKTEAIRLEQMDLGRRGVSLQEAANERAAEAAEQLRVDQERQHQERMEAINGAAADPNAWKRRLLSLNDNRL